ncbi:hypothetical protein [Sedimenticola thiotaurini]|uniref:Protein kinase domain-containing protein n=1 Tax=Sedimenticola thiotaurini TaxID=1543721 RepID=A0A0F7JWI2_9GAMM|nr:hypothetical protein [Sedimenticola thiotaurini]AKH20846.1 hypothetical protein AAY24_11355 [Sedimenticola thiotaurini]
MLIRQVLYTIVKKPERIFFHLSRKGYFYTNKVLSLLGKLKRSPQVFALRFYRKLPESCKGFIKNNGYLKKIAGKIVKVDRGARVYVNPNLSRLQFLEELNKLQVGYVLLRWWDALPDYPDEEDMDILVKDDDFPKIEHLFVDYATDIPCDVYTVSGSHGGHYRGLPYYPPKLANDLLATREFYHELAYVPSAYMYFVSMAYHALLHKGSQSGLHGFTERSNNLEHHYVNLLGELSKSLDLNLEITAQSLWDWLLQHEYAPGRDTLTKLVDIRSELELFVDPVVCDARGGELCLFVVREKAIERGMLELYVNLITASRIDIIKLVHLSPESQKECELQLRGGKWDKGPYPISGGRPAIMIVAYDYHPKPLTDNQLKTNRWFTNRHVPETKQRCRNELEYREFKSRHFNGLHSADNEHEAWHYLELGADSELDFVKSEVDKRRARYRNVFPVKEMLSEGRRSKVELISYHGIPAIKKTFRIGCERYFERELLAAEQLATELSFIPKLLDKGDGYLILPYLENILAGLGEKESMKVIRKYRNNIYSVIKEMYSRGLAYINFTPGNIIITPEGEFFAIDYEFLQSYRQKPDDMDHAYEVKGIPEDFDGDLPAGFGYLTSDFRYIWEPYVGSWESLLKTDVITC